MYVTRFVLHWFLSLLLRHSDLSLYYQDYCVFDIFPFSPLSIYWYVCIISIHKLIYSNIILNTTHQHYHQTHVEQEIKGFLVFPNTLW